MFAVIENGSRQHKVSTGDVVSIDFREDLTDGDTVTFDRVLLANGGGASVIGTPTIDGAAVVAEVTMATEKGPKLEIQKLRRRKNSRRHTGHRQKYTRVRISSIDVPGLEIVAAPAETEAEQPATAAAEG
jgi:large subunit ribosomal protein L21